MNPKKAYHKYMLQNKYHKKKLTKTCNSLQLKPNVRQEHKFKNFSVEEKLTYRMKAAIPYYRSPFLVKLGGAIPLPKKCKFDV